MVATQFSFDLTHGKLRSCLSFSQTINLIMEFKIQLPPGHTLEIQTTTIGIDDKSIKSTITTKNQPKRPPNIGIQTTALLVTLWIFYGYPVRIKRTGWLFEFHHSITLSVIWISRTVAGSKNWMSSKESLRVSSHSILITLDQK